MGPVLGVAYAVSGVIVIAALTFAVCRWQRRRDLISLLRVATERAEVLLEAQSDLGEGVVVVEDMRVVYANDAYCAMTGYTLDELKALPSVLDTVTERDHALLTDRRVRREAGEAVPDHYETTLVSRDGRELDVEVAVQALRRGGNFQTVTIVRDISERKIAERQLRAQRAQLAEAQHLAALGSWDWDIGSQEGAFSDEMMRILGLDGDPASASSEQLFEMVIPEDRRFVEEVMLHTMTTGSRFDLDIRVRRADGVVRTLQIRGKGHLDDQGLPVRIRGTAQDISERRSWEEAIQESNAKLRAVIDASPLPILAMDRLGAITIWNLAAETLFGWTESEVVGRFNPILPRDSSDEVKVLFTRLSNGESVTGHEAVRCCKDGSKIDVSVSSAPLRDGQGDVIGVISILADIRPAKKVEHALRDAVERLRAVDSMKDTFLTAVSHELRTPLTTVLGFAQTLEADGERLTPAQRTAIAGRIAENALKLEQLLTDLLDLDRLRRGIIEPRRRPVNLAVLVGRMLERAEVASRRNVHLSVEPAILDVDAAMIERIVENLLVNVDRYTPEDTDVWVKVSRTPEGAVIEVADAGPGVPEELRTHIFEPFEQGADAIAHSPGVGIGLSLVAKFAEAHGGRAEVTERPGGGAVFRVHLPAVPAPAPDEASIEPRRRPARKEAS